jgi:hypothetical protein
MTVKEAASADIAFMNRDASEDRGQHGEHPSQQDEKGCSRRMGNFKLVCGSYAFTAVPPACGGLKGHEVNRGGDEKPPILR